MSIPSSVEILSITGLRHLCAQESDRFFRRQEHDPRYCFELFRRAVYQRNEFAWELVYAQYQPLVRGWVERHSLSATADEETQYFVNRAFEKMWTALTPQKFGNFPDLKSVLGYLQMCVHSVIVDHLRSKERATLLDDERFSAIADEGQSTVERQVGSRLDRGELWRQLNERMRNDKERKIIYGSFVLAMKPREIFAQFSDSFDNIEEIYRVKENVMARLRRDKELKKIFDAVI
jgi:DNA-directed RNA polymerase specialized sigma24 family protein